MIGCGSVETVEVGDEGIAGRDAINVLLLAFKRLLYDPAGGRGGRGER